MGGVEKIIEVNRSFCLCTTQYYKHYQSIVVPVLRSVCPQTRLSLDFPNSLPVLTLGFVSAAWEREVLVSVLQMSSKSTHELPGPLIVCPVWSGFHSLPLTDKAMERSMRTNAWNCQRLSKRKESTAQALFYTPLAQTWLHSQSGKFSHCL